VASEALINEAHTCSAHSYIADGRRSWFFGMKKVSRKDLEYVLSEDSEERAKAFEEFLRRCFNNPSILHLGSYVLANANGRELILMHDSFVDSRFDLENQEYAKVCEALERNGLQKDALYPERDTIWFRKHWFLGGCSFKWFSPKEWEALASEKRKAFENWERIDHP